MHFWLKILQYGARLLFGGGGEGNVTLYVANPKLFLRTGPTFDSAPGLSACIPFPLPPASSTWQLDLEG